MTTRVGRYSVKMLLRSATEIAFSVLARDLASSGIRSDVKSVSRKFGMIKAKMTVAKGLEGE